MLGSPTVTCRCERESRTMRQQAFWAVRKRAFQIPGDSVSTWPNHGNKRPTKPPHPKLGKFSFAWPALDTHLLSPLTLLAMHSLRHALILCNYSVFLKTSSGKKFKMRVLVAGSTTWEGEDSIRRELAALPSTTTVIPTMTWRAGFRPAKLINLFC